MSRKRWIWVGVLVTAVLLIGVGAWAAQGPIGYAKMATGFGAKQMCSCLRISGRPLDSCMADFPADARNAVTITEENGRVHRFKAGDTFVIEQGCVSDFKTDGWTIEVGGLAAKPHVFSLDEFRGISPPEERVYRMRCVEAWSMVIPWAGFPLSKLLERVEPLPAAKFVAFQTLLDPERMPGQQAAVLKWPYVEGLRIDEAMHPLTLLATGIYGKELPPQDGAPVRLVVNTYRSPLDGCWRRP